MREIWMTFTVNDVSDTSIALVLNMIGPKYLVSSTLTVFGDGQVTRNGDGHIYMQLNSLNAMICCTSGGSLDRQQFETSIYQ